MVKNLYFNYHWTQIVCQVVVLDVFKCIHVIARGWSRTSASYRMGYFCNNIWHLPTAAGVTKSPICKTEVVLVLLLVVSACLGRIKGAHYIVIPKGYKQFHSTCQVLVWVVRASAIFVDRDLCGRSYTSPGLVLLGSISDRFFGFYFLSFWIVSMTDPSPVKCLMSAFGVSLSRKNLLKVNFNFFKTVLLEMFIAVLDNTKVNTYIWLNNTL